MKRTPLQRKTRLTAKHPSDWPTKIPRLVSVQRATVHTVETTTKPEWKAGRSRKGNWNKPKVPLKKVNVERQAKRRKSYAQKLAAYRRSGTYKVVEARSGHQCENVIVLQGCRIRCPVHGFGLSHHHKTYARFGGDELPSDMIVLCSSCHALHEAQHPTRRHGR